MVFAEICVDNTKKALLLKYPRRLMKIFTYKICEDLVNHVKHQYSCKLLKKIIHAINVRMKGVTKNILPKTQVHKINVMA